MRLTFRLSLAGRALGAAALLVAAACGERPTPVAPDAPAVPEAESAARAVAPPRLLRVPAAMSQIDAGAGFVCGVQSAGAVACWGSDPRYVTTVPAGSYTQVSGGSAHACAVRADRTVACWGANLAGEATPSAGAFLQVAAGTYHSCGIRTDGKLSCWGSNGGGKTTPPAGTFTRLSANTNGTCAIRGEGGIACWGSSPNGELTPAWGTFTQLSLGGSNGCAIRTDRTLACWGTNGSGESRPPAGSFTGLSVAKSGRTACAVRIDGALLCWGAVNDVTAAPPAGTYTAVSVAGDGACALRTDGAPVCWPAWWATVLPPGGGQTLAPTATFVAPDTVRIGQSYTIALTNASVPGWQGPVRFLYWFQCDNSPALEPTTDSGRSCVAKSWGTASVTGIVDDGQTQTRYSKRIVVLRNAQSVAITSTPPTPARAGGSYPVAVTYSATHTDPSMTAGPAAVCALVGQTVSLLGAGTCTVAVTLPESTTLEPARAEQRFAVIALPQTVAFTSAAPTAARAGGTYVAAATATSGLPVAFGTATPAVCTASGATITFVAIGTCTVTADQSGNGIIGAAPRVTQTFAVAAGTATITLGNLAQLYDGTPRRLTATTTPAGLPVTFLYAGGFTPPTLPGSYAVTASVGSTSFSGRATGTLVVSMARVTVTQDTISLSSTPWVSVVVHGSQLLETARLDWTQVRVRVVGGAAQGAVIYGVATGDMDGDGYPDRILNVTRAAFIAAGLSTTRTQLLVEYLPTTAGGLRFVAAPAVAPKIVP